MMTEIDTILFDLDGTLIDSAPDLMAAVNLTMRSLGKSEYNLEQISQWVGNGSKVLLKRAITGTYEAELEDDSIQEVLPLFFKYYAQNLCSNSQLYAGVLLALSKLQQAGFNLACVTNKPVEFTLPVLKGFGLDHFFPVVVGGGSTEQLKPSSEPLIFACQKLGVEPNKWPDTVLMVGDSASDIKAANALGIASVAVNYGYAQGIDLLALGATKQISSLLELCDFLGL